MEIINKDGKNENSAAETQTRVQSMSKWSGHIYFGLALIIIGVLWLLNNFDIMPEKFYDIIFSWQMLIIVLGGYLLSIKNWIAGGLLVVVGLVFMLTDIFGIYIPVGKIILPLMLIVFGISLLFNYSKKN